MPPAASEVPDTLRRAAEIIRERGWTPQRTYRRSDRRVTTCEALAMAATDADSHQAALDAVCRAIYGCRNGIRRGNSLKSVATWDRSRSSSTAPMLRGIATSLRRWHR